ncbi:C13 family peptidase [Nereida sp. MMG025]|uniref:C13 family peptidase n=1 Tax=Nereida sp. MMG025 TaxID=2909981 RepID=UPI001F406299|nr:C13 family peptidase [Nereida sp. MMG025]MCF6445559.1 C13 family peptidase [Nereida sp. MMG025]
MFRRLFLGLSLLALAGCVTPQDTPTSAPASSTGSSTGTINVTASALWDDAVFDRDTRAVVRALDQASDARIAPTVFAIDGKGGKLVNFEIMAAHYKSLPAADLYVSFITTHGLPQGLVAGNDEDYALVDARALNQIFQPLNGKPHVIILQACYSGALIPALQNPDRIIMTAAASNRTSFGCSNDNTNTWYTKALREAFVQDRALRDIYQTTRANVLAFETAQGIPVAKQSNPQANVGRNMRTVWASPL